MVYKEIKGNNYVWFYDENDKIRLCFGINSNKSFENHYINKLNISNLLGDNIFRNKYGIYFADPLLIKNIKNEIAEQLKLHNTYNDTNNDISHNNKRKIAEC